MKYIYILKLAWKNALGVKNSGLSQENFVSATPKNLSFSWIYQAQCQHNFLLFVYEYFIRVYIYIYIYIYIYKYSQ